MTEKTKPTVVVQWDPMPDVEGKKDLSNETRQEHHNVSGIRMWRVDGGWIIMLALLKIPTLRKVKEILILELNRMRQKVETALNNYQREIVKYAKKART